MTSSTRLSTTDEGSGKTRASKPTASLTTWADLEGVPGVPWHTQHFTDFFHYMPSFTDFVGFTVLELIHLKLYTYMQTYQTIETA